MNTQELNISGITGDVRIVNVSRMNYCLDSTDEFLKNKYGKAVVYKRGSQQQQIWTISQNINSDYVSIVDKYNRKLSSDKNHSVGAASFFPENDLMFNWVIEKRVSEPDKYGFTSAEVYIKNIYSDKYLTLRDNNDIILDDFKGYESQVWMLFETRRSISINRPYINLYNTGSISRGTIPHYLKRLWGNEQKMQDFTTTAAQHTSTAFLPFVWNVTHNYGGADNIISNDGNRLISRDGYAMVYKGDANSSYYEDQYWFIDFVLFGSEAFFIITNRRDGSILKCIHNDGEKTTVGKYTLFSVDKVNSNQYWVLDNINR